MYRIVYVSDAVRPMSQEDLDGVLSAARAFNAGRGISGLLVYAQQSFLQVIEGDAESIELAYSRAAASHLHRNLRRTDVHVSGGRRFPQWSMGFDRAAPGDVVEALLTPLVEQGKLSHQEVAGILLARFSRLSVPQQGSVQALPAH
ncbi:MAG: BLUF domain-containing protein [Mycobacteriales bacterium]